MLKLTQTSTDILEFSINYAKNFLVVALCLFLAFIIVLVFSYEHISLQANLSKDNLTVRHFTLLKGFKMQEFRLSSVKQIHLNPRSITSRSQKYSYENPVIIFKNGEKLNLLKSARQVGFRSNFADNFNSFLKKPSLSVFETTSLYFGIISAILLSVLAVVILILLALAFFIGNTNIIFDKTKNQYFFNYSSPMKQGEKGSLSDIENVLLLTRVKNPTFEHQAGLHLELTNEKTIMLQASNELSSNKPSEKVIQLREQAEKIASFLKVNLKEEEH